MFLLAAAGVQLGHSRSGEGGSWPQWIGWILALVGFALALAFDSNFGFLLLFVLSTLTVGIKKLGGDGGKAFAASGAGDLLLALALTARLAAGEGWQVPAGGMFPGNGVGQEGANLVAAAGALKLLAGSLDRAGKYSILWWQGAFLSLSAGRAATELMWIAAVAFAAWATYLGITKRARAPLVGASIAAALAAAGAPSLAILSAGLGAFSFELGNRTAALFTLGLLPLSVVSLAALEVSAGQPLGQKNPELTIAAVLVIPILWVGTALTLAGSPRVAPFGGGLGLASVALAVWFALTQAQLVPSVALTWMLYLLVLVIAASRLVGALSRGGAVLSGIANAVPLAAATPRWTAPIGVILIILWAVLTIRLLLSGLSTGFL